MKTNRFLSAAIFALAITFTFSCSGNDYNNGGGGSGGNKINNLCNGDKGNDIANYRIVQIGEQWWMAENLNYKVAGSKCYGEGAPVMVPVPPTFFDTLSNAELEANNAKYGRLYSWATAMALPDSCNRTYCYLPLSAKHRGICPSGWHIPSREDWIDLVKFISPDCSISYSSRGDIKCADSGTKLKAESGWNNSVFGGTGNGTDDYEFSALGGGYYEPVFNFDFPYFGGLGDGIRWWSDMGMTSEDSSRDTIVNYMSALTMGVNATYDFAAFGLSRRNFLHGVRCIKD